ncbi:MAG TPA: NADH-quinone oxidoreductase subunit H, partial [bacterium (Candidatus Stahlbacteria)]|nr:NADH-quinone oxidoreductase subunit H [Candidatus Stahlbacteria bacterium]
MNPILKSILQFVVYPGFLFSAAIGLLITWVDRKVTARIQWRVGPPIYQPYADFLKLLLKETLIPEGASRVAFILAPFIGLIGVSIVSTMLFIMNFNPELSFVGDIIVIVYLLALPPLAVIVGGSSSRNPLSSVGASREMVLYFGYELPFLLAIAIAIIKTGSLKIGEIIIYQRLFGPLLYSISGIIAGIVFLLASQAKLSFVPFDIPEAEQEIMAGPYLEYSGVSLAVFKLTRAMLFFILPVLLITLLWGGMTSLWSILKLILIVVLIVL